MSNLCIKSICLAPARLCGRYWRQGIHSSNTFLQSSRKNRTAAQRRIKRNPETEKTEVTIRKVKQISDIVEPAKYQEPVGQEGIGEEITGSSLNRSDVLKAHNDFKALCRRKTSLQKVLEENGIKEDVMFQKVCMSFRIYLSKNIRRLPPDLHVLLSDLTVHKKAHLDKVEMSLCYTSTPGLRICICICMRLTCEE